MREGWGRDTPESLQTCASYFIRSNSAMLGSSIAKVGYAGHTSILFWQFSIVRNETLLYKKSWNHWESSWAAGTNSITIKTQSILKISNYENSCFLWGIVGWLVLLDFFFLFFSWFFSASLKSVIYCFGGSQKSHFTTPEKRKWQIKAPRFPMSYVRERGQSPTVLRACPQWPEYLPQGPGS